MRRKTTFKEYLDAKGKLQEPKISYSGDELDVNPTKATKPEPAITKGKGWDAGVPELKNPTPYSAAGSSYGKNRKEDGFGKLGDKNLIFEPNTIEEDEDYFSFPGETTSSVWTMDKFIDQTKNMPIKEFIECIKNEFVVKEMSGIPRVYAYQEGNILPDPIQTVKYLAFLANANKKILESFVLEMKRNGSIDKLFESTLQHMEVTSPPAGKDEDEVKLPKKKKKEPKETELN